MIISNQQEVTPAVLEAIARSPDPRFREIMTALVRHLHDFARDVNLTEREFERAAATARSVSAAPSLRVVRARSTGRSARSCARPTGTIIARRDCTSLATDHAARR